MGGFRGRALISFTLAVPGDLDTPTGGYLYDKSMVEGARRRGHQVRVLQLSPRFPEPDQVSLDDADRQLRGVPDGEPLVIDGLALGAMPEVARAHRQRLKLIGLVHHPLADETGIDADRSVALFDSEKSALSTVVGTLVTSPFTARRLADFGVEPARLRVVVPGTNRLAIANRRDRPPWRLSCIASYTRRKGHDVLLDALSLAQDHAWRLTCVGAKGLDQVWEKLLEDRRGAFGDRVELNGPVEASARDALLARTDLFVLASHYEGYGMVLSEAVAAGVPVISTTGGAIPSTVPDGAGILVEPGDVDAFAGALRDWASDPQLRANLRAGAERARLQLPSWDQQCDLFLKSVTELAHG
ncbi:MAG: glycosyltransferase family 4 protein [Geminicoccaceae bacterium]